MCTVQNIKKFINYVYILSKENPLQQLHKLGHNCAKWKKWLILHNLSKKLPTPACA